MRIFQRTGKSRAVMMYREHCEDFHDLVSFQLKFKARNVITPAK